MGKEFIEYHSENGRIPYPASTLCFCLTQYAKDYISENRRIISDVDSKVRDAVLVDAINYLGAQGCIDFALYTKDLYDAQKHEEKVAPQCLLTAIVNHYACYMFRQGIVESVLRNNHMNECIEQFDADDGAIVLLDFINYIAKRNDYDRKFTINDLYEKFKIQEHKVEMNRLKDFLEQTSKYAEKLADGERIDNIFVEMAEEHNLYSISEDETYYCTDVDKEEAIVELKEMHPWTKQEVEENIYAMTYAYGKIFDDVKEQTQIEIINKKMLEMKKR